MSRAVYRCLRVIVMLLGACGARAATTDVEAVLETEVSEARVGDRIRMTLRVMTPDIERVAIVEPPAGDSGSTWTVLSKTIRPDTPTSGAGSVREAEYLIVSFRTGRHELPTVAVQYNDPGSTTPRMIEAKGEPVEIKSVLGQAEVGALAVRDIKPPVSLPLPGWLKYLVAAVIAVAVAGIGWLAFALLRRGRRRPAALELGLADRALAALEAVEREQLVEQKRVKDYYIRVGDTVRSYLGELLDTPALDMTSGELIDTLGELGVPEAAQRLVRELLDEADLVKFAKLVPDGFQCRRAMQIARDVIGTTRHLQHDPAGPGGDRAEAPPVEEADMVQSGAR